MRKTTVNKQELLTKVRANYEQHKKDYEEAFNGYKKESVNLLKARANALNDTFTTLAKRVEAADMKNGDKPVPLLVSNSLISFTELKVPVSHAKDYEQVITMLEMSVDDKITLESDEFACFVMDDWDWKAEFKQVTNLYKSSTTYSA